MAADAAPGIRLALRPVGAAASLTAAALVLALSGCGPAPSPPEFVPATTVVTLGDSVPSGFACECTAFPELYAHHEHASSVNLAKAGSTSATVRAELDDPAVRAALADADEVLLMVGANDVSDTFTDQDAVTAAAADVHTNVRAIIDAIQAVHATNVIVLGYWNVVSDGKTALDAYGENGVTASRRATDTINAALAAAAREGGAAYVSTDPAFHGADGAQDPTPLLVADGDHPDSAGHIAIAQLLPPLKTAT
ncbi:SGNH/GDSL hydrolase family protein [Actinoplanes sp. NPDC051859]|uniref:SGNH/GDSL hydrolase family protein n=1 Tax=Actinoplanes sp. NPDC051859 TaxID=3363909 RepID=UPI0037ABCAB5